MNWKDRFKNKTFLLSIAAAIIGFVYQILGLFEIVPSIGQDQITQLAGIVINILVGVGIVIDPTTPGIID